MGIPSVQCAADQGAVGARARRLRAGRLDVGGSW